MVAEQDKLETLKAQRAHYSRQQEISLNEANVAKINRRKNTAATGALFGLALLSVDAASIAEIELIDVSHNKESIKQEWFQHVLPSRMQEGATNYLSRQGGELQSMIDTFNSKQDGFSAHFPEEEQNRVRMEAERQANISADRHVKMKLAFFGIFAGVASAMGALSALGVRDGLKKDEKLRERRDEYLAISDKYENKVKTLDQQLAL